MDSDETVIKKALQRAQEPTTSGDALRVLGNAYTRCTRTEPSADKKAEYRLILRAVAKHPNTPTKTLRYLAHQSAILPYVRENPNYTIALLEKED